MKTTSSAESTHFHPPKHSSQSTGHSELAAPQPNVNPTKHILLVDDDPTVRDALNDVLVSEGYAVIPAENGQQALELIGKSAVDLVLLDLNMPIKNGWDTFEHLSREHPLVPIIIATARPNQLFTAVSAGVGALLEKPMGIPVLLQTITQLLSETPEQRLARLVGKNSSLHYKPSDTSHKLRVTSKPR